MITMVLILDMFYFPNYGRFFKVR